MAILYLSIVSSIIVLMDLNTKGTRQGNNRHAPKTRPIILLFITNVANIVSLTLGLLVSLTSKLANLGSI
jgi:hypothetical protein